MERNVTYFWEESGDLSLRGKCNPYACMLCEQLEKENFTLIDTPYAISKGELKAKRDSSKILHLNWLHPFYVAPTLEESLKMCSEFMRRLAFARSEGFRIVWTVHNLFPHERPFPELDVKVRLFVAQAADAIIAHCEYAADQIKRIFNPICGVHVIPIGNYIDAHPNIVSRDEARRKLDIPDDAFVYLNFGFARTYKGLESLIWAFRKISQHDTLLLIMMRRGWIPQKRSTMRRKLSRIRRRLSGEPPHPFEIAEHLDENADPRIHFHTSEYFRNDEFQYFLNAADVVVLPFNKILTSASAVLALSFGKPTIMPKLGCLPELVGEKTGILYEPRDSDALMNAMLDIRRWNLAETGSVAFARARELDWKTIAQDTAAVYRKILGDC